MLPDVEVLISSAETTLTGQWTTDTAFIVGVTERGSSSKPHELYAFSDFVQHCGSRLNSNPVSDWVETFFAEGGRRLYLSRPTGTGAKAAAHTFNDAEAKSSLVIKAGQGGDEDPGEWGNAYKVAIVAVTGGYEVVVSKVVSEVEREVERSGLLVTKADAVAWSRASSYVTISGGVSENAPAAVAAQALTEGATGEAPNDGQREDAWDRLPKELGPGQAADPGATTKERRELVMKHANANNRFAQLDATDTSTEATVTAEAQALYGVTGLARRRTQLYWPWDVIPGLTTGTYRTVPPSARACAQYARVDALGNPNQAAAGRFGRAQYVIDLSQPALSDSARRTMNEAGVTVSRRRFANAVVTSGIRTLADQLNDRNWSMASNVRTVMWLAAKFAEIGDDVDFQNVDGFGHALAHWAGLLSDPCAELWGKGALYGVAANDAFKVDVGPAVNPPSQLEEGVQKARVAVRTSPTPERTIIEVVKVPLTQEV